MPGREGRASKDICQGDCMLQDDGVQTRELPLPLPYAGVVGDAKATGVVDMALVASGISVTDGAVGPVCAGLKDAGCLGVPQPKCKARLHDSSVAVIR